MISDGGYGTGVAIERLGIFTMEEDSGYKIQPKTIERKGLAQRILITYRPRQRSARF